MNSGVELPEKIGMTLVGFARNPRLYVYVGEERDYLNGMNPLPSTFQFHLHRLQPCQFAQGVWLNVSCYASGSCLTNER